MRLTRRTLFGRIASGLAIAAAWPARALAARAQDAAGYYPPTLQGLRGSQPGSFERAHLLRDGALKVSDAKDTGEIYDLVIVGAGISGLAAAHFYLAQRATARILILDNHDDFGGHARRNEFLVDGRTLLMNGGTMLIDSPRPYSDVSRGLMTALGIDPKALSDAHPSDKVHEAAGLKSAVFFDKETFGRDQLIILPEAPEGGVAPPGALAAALAKAPLSDKARADIIRVEEGEEDYLPGLSAEAKMDRLSRISYREYLQTIVKVDDQVLAYYQTLTHDEFGNGADAEPALDCWGFGMPGFRGLKLDHAVAKRMGNTASGYSQTGGSESFHFPDGNATVARALVRKLIPAAAPPGDVESLVMARFDYGALDKAGQPVRLRLGATVVHAAPTQPRGVKVTYVDEDGLHAVSAKACVMAGYNMMIPYIVPDLPEAQKAALHELVKVPLVYVTVALRNWRAFAKLGMLGAYCPGAYYAALRLDQTVEIGGYTGPRSPDDPTVVHMLRVPCQPGVPSERDQHRIGRAEMLGTTLETFEDQVRDQLTRVLGPGGFNAKTDIAGIMVNRWPHGYAYEYNPLFDPWDIPEAERPHVIGRRRFGPIAIANSDAGAQAFTDSAIDQAHRAVGELLGAPELGL